MRNYRKLEKLYAKIPDIDCKGHCHPSCTIIPAAKIEVQRAKKRMGGKNPFSPVNALETVKGGKIPACSALKDERCSIYTARPAICRLYGVAEGLECPFGCIPKKKLTREEARLLIREIEAL